MEVLCVCVCDFSASVFALGFHHFFLMRKHLKLNFTKYAETRTIKSANSICNTPHTTATHGTICIENLIWRRLQLHIRLRFFCCNSLSFSLLLLFLGLATFVYSRTITIIIHYLMLLVVFEISSFCSIWASAAFLSAASIFAQINAQCAMAHYTVSKLCMPTEHVLHFEKFDRSFIKTLREVIPKKKREKKLSLFLAAGEYCIRWITNRNLWNDYLNHAYQQLIVDRHLCAASLGCFFFILVGFVRLLQHVSQFATVVVYCTEIVTHLANDYKRIRFWFVSCNVNEFSIIRISQVIMVPFV